MDENANSKQKLAKNTRIFLEETSPKNPFGPNYEGLTLGSKIAYKYNLLMQYVQLSPEDAELKLDEQVKYTGALILGVVGGLLLGMGSRRILKPIWPRAYEFTTDYKRFYYGIIVAGVTTEAYLKASDRYTKTVCRYLLDKYLEQGIRNGFINYQISGPKSMDMQRK